MKKMWLRYMAVGLLCSPHLLGQIIGTWTGNSGTQNWTDGSNWDTDPLYPGTTLTGGDQAIFPAYQGGAQATINLNSGVPLVLESILVENPYYPVPGTELTYILQPSLPGDSFTMLSASSTPPSIEVTNVNTEAALAISADIYLSSATQTLHIQNGAYTFTLFNPLTLSGVISDNGGGISLTSTASSAFNDQITLSGNNSYTGPTTIIGPCQINIQSDANFGSTVANAPIITQNSAGSTEIISSGSFTTHRNISISGGLFTWSINGTDTNNLAGIISGTGQFEVLAGASSAIQLSGVNTFQGGLYIGGNRIQVSADDNLGMAGGSIIFQHIPTLELLSSFTSSTRPTTLRPAATPATFLLDAATPTMVWNGPISGSGELALSGVGTLQLASTSNVYTGSTTVVSGTLQGGAINSFSSASAVTVDSGAFLDLNSLNQTIASLAGAGAVTLGSATLTTGGNNSSTIFSGTMSGTGGLIQAGTGTFTLSGSSSYSGATAVNEGTLQAGATGSFAPSSAFTVASGAFLSPNSFNQTIGSLTGAGTVTLGSAILTTGGNNSSTTFSGTMNGTGGLTKTGSGTFTLSGTSGYSGTTTISAGRMNVTGTLMQSPITVQNGAFLGGTGTIEGVVTLDSGGTIVPGTSIGTLTVASPFVFTTGSIFLVEIAPADLSSALNVIGGSGTTVQSGAILQLVADPGSYGSNLLYTAVSSASPITVDGAGFTFENPYPLINVSVLYNTNTIQLGLRAMPFSTLGLGGLSRNARAVAIYLDDSAPIPTGTDFNTVVSALKFTTSQQQLNDDLLQLEPSHIKSLALTQMQESHFASQAVANRVQSLFRNSCIRATGKKSRTTLWTDFWGDYAHQDGSTGYRAKTGGVLLGVDRTLLQSVVLGIAEGYSYSHVENGHLGHGSVQSFYTELYGAWFSDHLFLNASLLGAYNHYASKRRVLFGTGMIGGITIDRSPTADWGGGEVGAYLAGGGLIHTGGLDITPSLTGEYYYLHQGSFKEAGGDSIDLFVKSRNNDLLRITLGLDLSKCFTTNSGRWIPDVALNVVHLQSFMPGNFHSTMKGNPSLYFETFGISGSSTYIMPIVGLTSWLLEDRLSLMLQYIGQYNGRYSDSQGSFQASYAF